MNERMQEYLAAVEAYLAAQFTEELPQKSNLEAMRYSLLAGGKRIRPVLVLEFCRLFGGDWQKALPFAGAIEMVHTYSLIHDDLPCMDNDDYRRGRLTNHKVYGEAGAVLAGDGLLTAAFETVCSAELDAKTVVNAVRTLSECAGPYGMVGGQVLDLEAEDRVLPEDGIYTIQRLKTGALLKAACLMGAYAAHASEEQLGSAEQYAQALGLAFQTRDDMLDVLGDEEKMGKGLHSDEHKNTFVRLYGLERCRSIVQEQTRRAVEAVSCYPGSEFLTELAQSLEKRDH